MPKNIFTGTNSNNTLTGTNNDDVIYGGKGNDALTGDSGADDFVYKIGEGRDVITDFNLEEGDQVYIAIDLNSFGALYKGSTIFDGGVIFNFAGNSSLTVYSSASPEAVLESVIPVERTFGSDVVGPWTGTNRNSLVEALASGDLI